MQNSVLMMHILAGEFVSATAILGDNLPVQRGEARVSGYIDIRNLGTIKFGILGTSDSEL